MNKTIEINPALFHMAGNPKTKTIKNKSKPIISPSVLKNKFLKRIKQHKSEEIQSTNNVQTEKTDNIFDDEFNQSIEYLQQLSRDKKKAFENQSKRNSLERQTVKNYSSIYSNSTNVNIDLPDELKSPYSISVTPSTPVIMKPTPTLLIAKPIPSPVPISLTIETSPPPIPLIAKPNEIHNDVPYGILKGGTKPTFRLWNKTQKNLNSELTNKLQERNTQEKNIQERNNIQNKLVVSDKQVVSENNPQHNRTIKKKITKRYTLGKSKIKRKVGILIKNRETRKQVIMAHRELKNNSIGEIKTYLNEHNLIKIGSKAPNDVLRKLYESTKLSGDIYNLNNDILLHNIVKSDNNN